MEINVEKYKEKEKEKENGRRTETSKMGNCLQCFFSFISSFFFFFFLVKLENQKNVLIIMNTNYKDE